MAAMADRPSPEPCTAAGCDKIHMSNGHHYGCQCFGCVHEYLRLKRGK